MENPHILKETYPVLVVEDDKAMNHLIAKHLKREGLLTESAFSGSDAIRKVVEKQGEMILLLDFNLQDMNGKELLEALAKEIESIPPFIVMTEYGDETIAVEMMKAGAIDYITKSKTTIDIIPHILSKSLNVIHEKRKLKLAEAENKHIKKVLYAIREINRQIVQEKDRKKLLQKICDLLINTRGYSNAWVLLMDEEKPSIISSAGYADINAFMKDQISGGHSPKCAELALKESGIVFIEDRDNQCKSCPFKEKYEAHTTMAIRLEYAGTVYGVLSVTIDSRYVEFEEEQGLFREIAGDVSFALHDLELEALTEKTEDEKINILESISNIFFSLDDQLNITYYNGAAAKQFGKIVTEVAGKPFFQTFPEFAGTKFEEKFSEVLQSREPIAFELNFEKEPYSDWYDVRIYPYRAGISIYCQVITDRKQAELSLEESERKFKTYIENSPDSIFISDKQGDYQYVNSAACKLLGYSCEELTRMNIADISVENELKSNFNYLNKILKGENIQIEIHLVKKDASVIPVDLNTMLLPNGMVLGSCRDVSERKQIEIELKNNNTFLNTVMNQSPFAMWIADKEGTVLRTNQSLRNTLNLEDNQIIGKYNVLKDQNLIDQDVMKQVDAVFKQKKTARFRIHWLPQRAGKIEFNGAKPSWIEASLFPIADVNDQLTNVVCQWIDISEQKRAEDLLIQSEKKYRTLFETMAQGVVYQNAVGKITSANPAAERILGLNLDQMMGRMSIDSHWQAVDEDKNELSGNKHPAMIALKTGKPVYNFLMGVFNPEKEGYVWILVNSIPQFKKNSKKPSEVYSTFLDITDRIQAEEKLETSLALLDEVGKLARVGGWELDVETMTVHWSDETCRIHEMPLGTTPTLEEAIQFFHPDDREKLKSAITKAIEKEDPYDLEIRFITAKGNSLWTRTLCKPQLVNGKTVKLVGTFQDITESKKFRDALMKSEEGLKEAQALAMIGNWSWNLETNNLYLSDEMYNIMGLKKNADALDVANHEKYYTPESWVAFQHAVEKTHKTGEPYEIDLEMVRKEEPNRTVVARGKPVLDEKGNIIELRGTLQDITERKKTEQELQALNRQLSASQEDLLNNQYRLAKAQEIGKIGPWELDLVKNELTWTEQNYRNFGVPIGTPLTYEIFLEYVHPEDRDYVDKQWTKAIHGAPYDIEHRLLLDGQVKWVREKANVNFDKKGNAIYAIGFTQDITQRKQAEEARRKSDERFRIAQDTSPEGFTILHPVRNKNGRVIDFSWVYENKAVAKMNGTDPEKVVGQRLLNLFPGHRGTQFLKTYIQVAESGESVSFEDSYCGESIKSLKWFRITVVPMAEDIAILSQDITDRKEAEIVLLESKKTAENYLNIVSEIILSLDEQGTITLLNESGHALLGYQKDRLIGKNWFETCLPQNHKKEVKEVFSQIMNGTIKDLESVENDVITKNGKTLKILWHNTFLRDHDGHITGTLSSGVDITERKKAEEMLRKNRDQMTSLVDNLIDSLMITNKNGVVKFANNASFELFGKEQDDLIGISIGLPTNMENIFEMEIKPHNKKKQYAEVRSSYIDWEGEPSLLLSLRNITKQKQAHEKLKKYQDELEDIVRLRTKELEEKNQFLERMNDAMVDREFRIKELRDQIDQLQQKLKHK